MLVPRQSKRLQKETASLPRQALLHSLQSQSLVWTTRLL
jgi:hypothetical protein